MSLLPTQMITMSRGQNVSSTNSYDNHVKRTECLFYQPKWWPCRENRMSLLPIQMITMSRGQNVSSTNPNDNHVKRTECSYTNQHGMEYNEQQTQSGYQSKEETIQLKGTKNLKRIVSRGFWTAGFSSNIFLWVEIAHPECLLKLRRNIRILSWLGGANNTAKSKLFFRQP